MARGLGTHEIYSLRARDVMNRSFVLVSPLANVQEAVERMVESGTQAVIVDRADEDDAYGIVTFQEIVYQLISKSLSPTRVRIADIMVKPLIVINPYLRLPFIAQLFANTGIQNAPVIEEHRLVGIISSADLVRALLATSQD
jgi:predicted transcriptional regulator